MKNTVLFCAFSISLIFSSCNPRITTQLIKSAIPFDSQQEVTVIELDESVPSKSVVLGDVKIDDSGFTTNCSYEYVLELAKMEARKAGGNALKLTKHIVPNFHSTCHRISAYILLIDGKVSETVAQDTSSSLQQQVVEVAETPVQVVIPKFRLNVHGGLGEMIGKSPDNLDPLQIQYNKELYSGYSFGTDLTYFFSESTGFGLKCDLFRTSNSLSGVYIEDSYGNRAYGDISDNIGVLYIGPTWNYRKIGLSNMNTLYMSVSAGFSGYYNQACVINRLILYGSTFGSSVDVGYDINLSKRLALGLKLSLSSGVLKELTIDDGSITEQYTLDENSYLSLSHIDFTVGLSFIK